MLYISNSTFIKIYVSHFTISHATLSMAFTIKDNDVKICLDRIMPFYQKMNLNDNKISTQGILKMLVYIIIQS